MKKIIDKLIKQSANPEGLLGNIITKIWQISFRNLSKFTIGSLDIRNGDNILEVGVGGGINLVAILDVSNNINLYGIDISKEAIKAAGRLVKPYKKQVILSGDDVITMDFAENYFDIIVAMQTHIYWLELEKGLFECYRILKTGGYIVISTERDKISYHLKRYKNTDKFINLLKEIGFKKIEIVEQNNFILFKGYK